MVGINAAWETIKDPVRRAAYDRLRDEAAARRAEQPAAAQPAAAQPAAAQRPAPSGETSRASHETSRTSPPASPRAPGDGFTQLDLRPFHDRGAATTPPRCAHVTDLAPPVSPQETHREASSTSVGTRAGRSVRSPAATSITWSGLIGCPSAGLIGTRSTPSSGRRADGEVQPPKRSVEGCSGDADELSGPQPAAAGLS